jgi:hypothetical protein
MFALSSLAAFFYPDYSACKALRKREIAHPLGFSERSSEKFYLDAASFRILDSRIPDPSLKLPRDHARLTARL